MEVELSNNAASEKNHIEPMENGDKMNVDEKQEKDQMNINDEGSIISALHHKEVDKKDTHPQEIDLEEKKKASVLR